MNSVRMAAASIVSASIASILEDRDFDSNTPQVVTVKEKAEKLIDASTADDHSRYVCKVCLKARSKT